MRDGELVEGTERPNYAYHHCRGRCRAVNISKSKLEELFVEELTRLQPTPGLMRLVKDRVLRAWREMQGDTKQRIAKIERSQKEIREKRDRLYKAFLFERSIDIETYDRYRDTLREELTLAQMNRHSAELEELDVEGILAFAERGSTERVEPMGPVLARSEAAASAAVFPGPHSLRREEPCWNRYNLSGLQLLEPDFGREKDLVTKTAPVGTTSPAGCTE